MDTYIVLGQQTWTEFKIIIKIERSASFETSTESRYWWALSQLFHASYTSELPVGVLGGRQARRSSGPAAVVVMRR